MSNPRRKHWPDPWKRSPAPDPKTMKKEDLQRLGKWMMCMVEWGENLRDDLIRLEGSLGVSVGDPGDPPPPPWGDNDVPG